MTNKISESSHKATSAVTKPFKTAGNKATTTWNGFKCQVITGYNKVKAFTIKILVTTRDVITLKQFRATLKKEIPIFVKKVSNKVQSTAKSVFAKLKAPFTKKKPKPVEAKEVVVEKPPIKEEPSPAESEVNKEPEMKEEAPPVEEKNEEESKSKEVVEEVSVPETPKVKGSKVNALQNQLAAELMTPNPNAPKTGGPQKAKSMVLGKKHPKGGVKKANSMGAKALKEKKEASNSGYKPNGKLNSIKKPKGPSKRLPSTVKKKPHTPAVDEATKKE